MNPLTWFKEFARRSQTQDLVDRSVQQAGADRENILGTVVRQDEAEKIQTQRIQGLLEQEKLQQAGANYRNDADNNYRVAKDASESGQRLVQNENTWLDNSRLMTSPDAIRTYLEANGARPALIETALADHRARAAKEKPTPDYKREEAMKLVTQTKTSKALRAILAGYPQYAKDPTVLAHAADVAAAEDEAGSIRRHRERPPAPEKVDKLTDSERLAYQRRNDVLKRALPNAETPEEKAAIEEQISANEARLAPPTISSDELMKGFLQVLK